MQVKAHSSSLKYPAVLAALLHNCVPGQAAHAQSTVARHRHLARPAQLRHLHRQLAALGLHCMIQDLLRNRVPVMIATAATTSKPLSCCSCVTPSIRLNAQTCCAQHRVVVKALCQALVLEDLRRMLACFKRMHSILRHPMRPLLR
jgi:hypothetical protein